MDVRDGLRRFFTTASHPVLFAGAGVSTHGGMPTWNSLLRKMAEPLKAANPDIHAVIERAISKSQLTAAAAYLKACPDVTDGDKARHLRAALDTTLGRPEELVPLIKLPFRSALTTNFDRLLHDAYAIAHRSAPHDYRYGDQSLANAIWSDQFHVTRIHGAMESYESVVLSDDDFRILMQSSTYFDLLSNNFTQRNVLFVGFSFYDPAIRHVMTELEKRFKTAAPGQHMALVPSGISSEFLTRASALNIEVVTYSDEDYHRELWEAIDAFELPKKTQKPVGLSLTKKYLAACYTRVKNRQVNTALKDALAEGIVAQIVKEQFPEPITKLDLAARLSTALGIKNGVEQVLDMAVQPLVNEQICSKTQCIEGGGYQVAWTGNSDSRSLSDSISRLCNAVVDRAKVTKSWDVPANIQAKLPALFEHIVRSRGWDLGAAFAERMPPDPVSVSTLIAEFNLGGSTLDSSRLEEVLTIMFQRPAADESELLMELGMISFGLEMAFHLPNTVFLQEAVMPRNIYFDASVIMPACVYGHPLYSTYNSTIDRLRSAALEGGYQVSLKICFGYLNEIISHRRQAMDFYKQLGDGARGASLISAMYHGPANTNVFIAGFAHHIESHPDATLYSYLNEFAPYQTEAELKRWLTRKQFEIVAEPQHDQSWSELSLFLQRAYADQLSRSKTSILIEHDADQLKILKEDIERGMRSIFVTADKQLIGKCQKGYNHLAEHMMSSASVVQFIVLMLGGIAPSAGITELLWSTRLSDRTHQIRSHLTAAALKEYNSTLMKSMPDVIDEATDAIEQEMKRLALDLDSLDPIRKAEAFRVFGNLTDELYFKKMRLEIERL
ncbi:SIR2 family protein [Stenotrophomonas maltophilia]|uniref:SIR2 family NAD-dependent protein deacylase n=1 Tax=Stenotrophomonas maltophilia TaxID=40324 RepID=UPI0021C61992|nr:SIR2 family protein [Stenotrophomonas maltophilia]MCU1091974.1 SIR2 family protein [Stenotrophomonas maltophilia]